MIQGEVSWLKERLPCKTIRKFKWHYERLYKYVGCWVDSLRGCLSVRKAAWVDERGCTRRSGWLAKEMLCHMSRVCSFSLSEWLIFFKAGNAGVSCALSSVSLNCLPLMMQIAWITPGHVWAGHPSFAPKFSVLQNCSEISQKGFVGESLYLTWPDPTLRTAHRAIFHTKHQRGGEYCSEHYHVDK